MKKLVPVLLAALVFLAITGCTTTGPSDIEPTNNSVGSKVGEASGTLILGGAFGGTVDASLQTAAANAGITRIATVDERVHTILGIVTTYTTIVTGE
jgi:hypothetical protein